MLELLGDRALRRQMGEAAQERVRSAFLLPREVADRARLIAALLA